MAADPHNVVRLILPRQEPGRPGEEYHNAAALLGRWLDERILVADPVPALYVYEQADMRAVLQRGLIGRLRLVAPEAGIVLPHEDVAPGPVEGRLQLMEATQANLEPIFLLYDGAAHAGEPAFRGAATRIINAAAGTEPLIEALTRDGLRHRLWAITEDADLAAIAADLAPRQAMIADGHHRYAAYLRLQERRRQAGAGPGPWDYGLALLVDSSSYPPHIGAIHRVIPGLDAQHAAKLAAGAFIVRELPADRLDTALAELKRASTEGAAFLVAAQDHVYLLSHPDQEQTRAAMPAGYSAQWGELPAAILQELLISKLWGVTDDERLVKVVHHDAEAAVRTAAEVSGIAVICSPMTPADVHAVAARGEKVPRKSTSFAPKPRTGVVLRTFAQG